MKRNDYRRDVNTVLAIATVLTALATNPPRMTAQQNNEPDVKITEIPPAKTGSPDEMYPISGTVSGTVPKDCKVVIYVYSGDRWWVQPFDYSPLTEIKANGKFETETHPGTIYAALVVKASFKPQGTLRSLPDVGGDIVARYRVAGKRP